MKSDCLTLQWVGCGGFTIKTSHCKDFSLMSCLHTIRNDRNVVKRFVTQTDSQEISLAQSSALFHLFNVSKEGQKVEGRIIVFRSTSI
jgi:hypothetical protein